MNQRAVLFFASATLVLSSVGQEEKKASPAADPSVVKSESSYALGFQTGGGFAQQFGRFGVTVDDLEREQFIKGFFDAVKGDNPAIEESKLQAAMQGFGDLLQKRETELAASNLEEGRVFSLRMESARGLL